MRCHSNRQACIPLSLMGFLSFSTPPAWCLCHLDAPHTPARLPWSPVCILDGFSLPSARLSLVDTPAPQLNQNWIHALLHPEPHHSLDMAVSLPLATSHLVLLSKTGLPSFSAWLLAALHVSSVGLSDCVNPSMPIGLQVVSLALLF